MKLEEIGRVGIRRSRSARRARSERRGRPLRLLGRAERDARGRVTASVGRNRSRAGRRARELDRLSSLSKFQARRARRLDRDGAGAELAEARPTDSSRISSKPRAPTPAGQSKQGKGRINDQHQKRLRSAAISLRLARHLPHVLIRRVPRPGTWASQPASSSTRTSSRPRGASPRTATATWRSSPTCSKAASRTDSMGNGSTHPPRRRAANERRHGVRHSEFNGSEDERVHLLQIGFSRPRRG